MICKLCGGLADENGLHRCEETGEVVSVASSPELFMWEQASISDCFTFDNG